MFENTATEERNPEGHPYDTVNGIERQMGAEAFRIIRRFIPKDCDISTYIRKQIQAVEDWINNYPRKTLDFEPAEQRFIQELGA